MTRIVKSHGFKFNVEGEGFVRSHAEADFDLATEAIEAHLDAMSPNKVSAIHFADRAWQVRDCDGDRPTLIDELESVGFAAATAGWHNPHAVIVMVSASA